MRDPSSTLKSLYAMEMYQILVIVMVEREA
jgi:hypothetical protein